MVVTKFNALFGNLLVTQVWNGKDSSKSNHSLLVISFLVDALLQNTDQGKGLLRHAVCVSQTRV